MGRPHKGKAVSQVRVASPSETTSSSSSPPEQIDLCSESEEVGSVESSDVDEDESFSEEIDQREDDLHLPKRKATKQSRLSTKTNRKKRSRSTSPETKEPTTISRKRKKRVSNSTANLRNAPFFQSSEPNGEVVNDPKAPLTLESPFETSENSFEYWKPITTSPTIQESFAVLQVRENAKRNCTARKQHLSSKINFPLSSPNGNHFEEAKRVQSASDQATVEVLKLKTSRPITKRANIVIDDSDSDSAQKGDMSSTRCGANSPGNGNVRLSSNPRGKEIAEKSCFEAQYCASNTDVFSYRSNDAMDAPSKGQNGRGNPNYRITIIFLAAQNCIVRFG